MKLSAGISTVIAALLLCAVAPACYTLLKHPRVREAEAYRQVSDRRCSTCHAEDELWSFHHAPNHRLHVTSGYEAWGHFYDVPWWYNDYWYYDPADPATIPLRSRAMRPAVDSPRTTVRPPATKTTPGARVIPNTEGSNTDDSSKSRSVRPTKKKEKRKPKRNN